MEAPFFHRKLRIAKNDGMRTQLKHVILGIASLPFFICCQPDSNNEVEVIKPEESTTETQVKASEQSLEKTLWESVYVEGFEDEIPGDYNPSIAMIDSRVSGTTGCNKYSGSYTIEGQKIEFSPLAMTKMACLNELGDLEMWFTEAMTQVQSYKIDQKQLILYNEQGNEVIVLEYVQDLDF